VMRLLFAIVGFLLLSIGFGCASRLSPKLHQPPSSAGLAVVECFLYPEDPTHVRSKFAAPDSFPARVAYLESMNDGHAARGLSVYGTGYVLFPDLEPGEYRLTRVRVETREYSMALSHTVATDYEFKVPEQTHASVRVEPGEPVYVGALAIRRAYGWEDVGRAPSDDPTRRSNARVTLERSDEGEARAWTELLARKKYRRSAWRGAIEKRLAEIQKK